MLDNSIENFSLKLEDGDKVYKGRGFKMSYHTEESFMSNVLSRKNDLQHLGHINVKKPADKFEKENLMQVYVPNSQVSFSYFTSDKKQNVIGYVQIGEDRYVTLVKPNLFGRIKGRIDKRK